MGHYKPKWWTELWLNNGLHNLTAIDCQLPNVTYKILKGKILIFFNAIGLNTYHVFCRVLEDCVEAVPALFSKQDECLWINQNELQFISIKGLEICQHSRVTTPKIVAD